MTAAAYGRHSQTKRTTTWAVCLPALSPFLASSLCVVLCCAEETLFPSPPELTGSLFPWFFHLHPWHHCQSNHAANHVGFRKDLVKMGENAVVLPDHWSVNLSNSLSKYIRRVWIDFWVDYHLLRVVSVKTGDEKEDPMFWINLETRYCTWCYRIIFQMSKVRTVYL